MTVEVVIAGLGIVVTTLAFIAGLLTVRRLAEDDGPAPRRR